MAFNLTEASRILKVRYIGTIRQQFNKSTVLLDKIGRSSQPVSGKTFTVPLHTGRHTYAGAGRAEYGTLPAAANQKYSETIVPPKYLYARIEVTGPTIAATRDNMGAFVQALESEVDGVTRDFKRAVNRQLNGDGRDALAFWTTADDTSGTTVDDGAGNAFVHLEPVGTMKCDLIDASDHSTVLGDSLTVTLGAKGASSYAITWTGTVSGSADGDYLVLEDSLGYQMMGVDGIIDDGDPALGALQSLAVSSNPFWKAQVFGNSGTARQLAFEDMQEVLDAIETNTAYESAKPEGLFMFSSHGMRRAYYKLCIAERRHINTMELDGGWKALDFNGIGWVVDPQASKGNIKFINPDTMKIFQMGDGIDWMDRDGSYLTRVADKDSYEGVLFWYANLAALSRNGNGRLEDLIEA